MRQFEERCLWQTPAQTLVIAGPTGTGKTSLALTVGAMLVPHLGAGKVLPHNGWLNSLLPDGSDRPRREVLALPHGVPFLVVDDFGAEREPRPGQRPGMDAASPAARQATVELMNARSRPGLVTVVTTNLLSEDVERVWGDRVLSRLAGEATMLVRLFGADRRRPLSWSAG